jgi:uncharacterized repeat protein (TIGR03803 family)
MKKIKSSVIYAFVLIGIMIDLSSLAGVIVSQNVSPGATSWPGSPIIQTVTNPAVQTTVGESFNANGATNYCETFTIAATNYTLQTISIYAGGGTGTGTGTNLTLRLFDLGTQIAPNPSPYSPSTDLFNSGSGLIVAYSPQTTGVLRFDFTGSDQVTLTNGHLYAFEMDGVLNTSPMVWQRTTNDTYAGGAAYRNRSWINGNSARDFAMAVYATVLANTNTASTNSPWVPTGIVFHAFTSPSSGINSDGANPAAGLALSGGVLVGTTLNGGAQGVGTAFYMSTDGSQFVTIRSFASASDANYPQGELTVSGSGFYGTSFGGGSAGVGSVFLGQTNGSDSVICSFPALSADTATNSGGASPGALLVLSGGTLYGTTTAGGAGANGTVFSQTTNGATFSVLHDFSLLNSQAGTNADGAVPYGGLVLSGSTLYGTASAGGAGGAGVVFSVNMDGTGYTTLYNFTPLDSLTATNADGAFPVSGLVLSNGILFGTTIAGGAGGKGTIFSVGTNSAGFTVLHNFSATDPTTSTNSDGASPSAGLILSGNVLYGTASAGGVGAAGAVYSLNLNTSQFATIRSFTALAGGGTNTDGAFPVAPVLQLGGSLYGTTFGGGPGGVGTVFSLSLAASPAPPAVITNIVLHLDGSVTLYFLGGPNSTNIIQTASSLMPPVAWQAVSTNVADVNGLWQFTNSNTTASSQFYRSYAP